MRIINIPIPEINKEIEKLKGINLPEDLIIGIDHKNEFWVIENGEEYKSIGNIADNCPQVKGISNAIKKCCKTEEFFKNCETSEDDDD